MMLVNRHSLFDTRHPRRLRNASRRRHAPLAARQPIRSRYVDDVISPESSVTPAGAAANDVKAGLCSICAVAGGRLTGVA